MVGSVITFLASEIFKRLLHSRNVSSQERESRIRSSIFNKVRLIHSSELQSFTKLPNYKEFQGISLESYRNERAHLKQLALEYAEPLRRLRALEEINHDRLVEISREYVSVPGSIIGRLQRLSVQRPHIAGGHVTTLASEGTIRGDMLEVKSHLKSREIAVTHHIASKVHYKNEIAEIESSLASLNDEDAHGLQEIRQSRFSDPVLFISHRWDTPDEPDPSGSQLAKLRNLQNCFIIYDYTSFPQAPLSDDERQDLSEILSRMTDLIENVVILRGDDYTSRGWCLYEYLASALKNSVVCDEMQDFRFKELRNWICSHPPPPANPFHDGTEALIQNYINGKILGAINEIVSMYRTAQFSNENDRHIVQNLLVNLLLERLPAKREHQSTLDSRAVKWTRAELEAAFTSTLTWEDPGTLSQEAFQMQVPEHLADAATALYRVNIQAPPSYSVMSALSPLREFYLGEKSLSPRDF